MFGLPPLRDIERLRTVQAGLHAPTLTSVDHAGQGHTSELNTTSVRPIPLLHEAAIGWDRIQHQWECLTPALHIGTAEDATVHLRREDEVWISRVERTALVQRLELFGGEADVQRAEVVVELLKLAGA